MTETEWTVLPRPAKASASPTVPLVSVLADDPLVGEGAVARLSASGVIRVAGPDEAGSVDVLLMLAGVVTEGTLAGIRKAVASRTRPPGIVLVAGDISEMQLVRAVECGVTSLLLRPEISYEKIIDALSRCRHETVLPGAAMRTLIEHLRRARAASSCGLSPREIEILRQVADGVGTAEIASKMRYSERTIKNILNGVMKRHSLRNRAHAVSYAMRAGLL
ncbi:response regulator transcription factor [Streptomyces sp. NPDC088847]|uniref:helix-turn-helix transcriptional regulator n=1 Tax=Streptomyces sp. NPDC088847 TaxID=3365909 RepID=UPI00380047EB